MARVERALGWIRGRKTTTLLLWIVIGALSARLAYVALFGNTLSLLTSGYDTYAFNVMVGNGYTRALDWQPDSDLPPLYPFFLVGVYSLFGRSAISVALVQVVLDMLTVVLIFAIGKRVGGSIVGLLAAAFTGFYPYLLFQNLTVNDTAVFLFLLVLGVWAIYRTAAHHDWRDAVLVGLALGLAALTKTLAVLIGPLAVLWWWRKTGFGKALVMGLIAGTVAFLVLVPWVARNMTLHGAFTLISTNDGSNLHQGNNPCVADYLFNGWDAQWVNCLPMPPDGLSELEISAWHRDQVIAYLKDNLNDVPRLLLAKLYALWTPEIFPRSVPPDAEMLDEAALQFDQPAFRVARIIHLLYFTPLLIAALIGWRRAIRERAPVAPLLMVIVSITAAYLLFHPSTRYRMPADPFVFILAAYAVAPAVSRWGRPRPALLRPPPFSIAGEGAEGFRQSMGGM